MKNKNLLIIIVIIGVISFIWFKPILFSTISKPNYLIITTSSIDNSLSTLKSYRSNDYNVKTILVDGMSKENIRQQIISNSPQYVLIVGPESSVPSDSNSDNYYSDNNNDKIPEYALGRIPSNNPQEITNIINKIIQFENQKQYNIKDIMFIGGSEVKPPESTGWKTGAYFDENIVPYYSSWNIDKVYCYCQNLLTNCPTNKQQIINYFNQGETIVAFNGHGSSIIYFSCDSSSNSYLGYADINSITTTRTPIFISFSCATITFSNPNYMSYSFLFNQKGIVAFVGSTVNGGSFPNTLFNEMLKQKTLGDAFKQSKIKENDNIMRFNFQLLGDPALKISDSTTCTSSNTCASNTCIGTTCTDSCGNSYQGTKICTTACTSGQKECLSSTSYKQCNSGTWSGSLSCASGQTCSIGACSSTPSTCPTFNDVINYASQWVGC